jgi:hypothetical protein
MTTPTPTFPIPQFVRIEQNQTTDAVNQLIVDINAILIALGAGPGPLPTFDNLMTTWFNALPTTLPATAGKFWNNGGTLAQS